MSVYVNPYNHLSDSVERQLAHSVNLSNRPFSALEGMVIVAKAISSAAGWFGRYLLQVAEALNEARAANARFSGSQW